MEINLDGLNFRKERSEMTVEAKIKNYLQENGIKQNWISEKTGVPAGKISLTLNGHRRLTFAEYELICGALDIPVDTFLQPKRYEPQAV